MLFMTSSRLTDMEDRLASLTPLHKPCGDLPHFCPGRQHLDALSQPSIGNHSRKPVEPARGRLCKHFVEQDETVESRTARQVEGPGVELYLWRGRCPEAYAGSARRQHRERVPEHLPADRFDDEVVDESGAAARDRGPYHLVLESVGGEVLGNALSMLAPGGTCVSFGTSASTEVEFDARTFYLTGGARLYGFILFHEVLAKPASGGLDRLARMVADGRLKPRIEVEAPWTEVGEIAGRLIERSYTGKAVLRVGPN